MMTSNVFLCSLTILKIIRSKWNHLISSSPSLSYKIKTMCDIWNQVLPKARIFVELGVHHCNLEVVPHTISLLFVAVFHEFDCLFMIRAQKPSPSIHTYKMSSKVNYFFTTCLFLKHSHFGHIKMCSKIQANARILIHNIIKKVYLLIKHELPSFHVNEFYLHSIQWLDIK